MIERAHAAGVKVTAMSCKETCDLVIMMKEEQSPLPSDRVQQFASFLCKLDRGGYVVMLGVVPLEMMLLYEMKDYAAQYVALWKRCSGNTPRTRSSRPQSATSSRSSRKSLVVDLEPCL